MRGDVFQSPKGLALRIRWAKTIQFQDRVFLVPLPFLHNHPLCPVTALCVVLAASPSAPDESPLFCYPVAGGYVPLTQSVFNHRLKSLLTDLGLTPSQYSGHSFRRGGASWAFAAGLPGEFIQLMGDWHSSAYKMYLEIDIDFKFQLLQKFSTSLPS